MAVLDPLKLVLTNWDEVIGKGQTLPCSAPLHPASRSAGSATFTLGPEVWIERDDFMEEPPKGYLRLSPPRFDGKGAQIAGSVVRLKYGYVIECTGLKKNVDGSVAEV